MNFYERNNFTLQVVGIISKTVDGFYKNIYAFVAPLVASACRNYHGIVGNSVASKGTGDVKQPLTGFFAFFVESLALRHEVVLKTVWQHYISFAVEKFLALPIRNVAHGCKAIYM